MNESAVMPTATMSPAIPGSVSVKPAVSLSARTAPYVAAAAIPSDAMTTIPRPR